MSNTRSKSAANTGKLNDTPNSNTPNTYATEEAVKEFRDQFDNFSSKVFEKLDNVTVTLLSVRDEMKNIQSSLHEVEVLSADSAMRIDTLERETLPAISKMQKECDQSMRDSLMAMEIHDRKQNLLFYGVPQSPRENIMEILRKGIVELGLPEDQVRKIQFVNAHRLPRKSTSSSSAHTPPSNPDPIIARFLTIFDRDAVLSAFHESLKRPRPKSAITVRIDLPQKLKQVRYELEKAAYDLRKTKDMSTRIRLIGTKLVLEYRPKAQRQASWLLYRE